MRTLFGITAHIMFLITFAFGDNKITQFVENEAILTSITMWEARKEISERFGAKFTRSCDPSGEACSAFPLMACVENNGLYIVFWSDLTSNFEEINTIIFRLDKPIIPCVSKGIRDTQTTMIGKTAKEIIAQFDKPKNEAPCFASVGGEYVHSSDSGEKLSSICYRYETDLWQEWSAKYKTNITRYDIIEFEFNDGLVASYRIHKGAE
jgi:hypothetical protein